MVSGLPIIERRADGSSELIGHFDFAEFPRIGEDVVLGNSAGGLMMTRVVGIEHSPAYSTPMTPEIRIGVAKCTIFVEVVDWDMEL